MPANNVYIGTAGWNIPKTSAAHFSKEGTHLERYAQRLSGVEINSTFYNRHKPETFVRWGDTVPTSFRFSVKVPQWITHEGKLLNPTELDPFLDDVRGLGDRLGPLLVQIPKSLGFEKESAQKFFGYFREKFTGQIVFEPRHPAWFSDAAEALLVRYQVSRVAADPAVVMPAGLPAGWRGVHYHRLHGSPDMYASTYSREFIETLARDLSTTASPAWVIFDNTKFGAATENALELSEIIFRRLTK